MKNDVQWKVIQVTIPFSHFRKILNELSSEEVTHIEGKDNSPASTGVTGVTVPTTGLYQTSSGQYSTDFSLFNSICIRDVKHWDRAFQVNCYTSTDHRKNTSLVFSRGCLDLLYNTCYVWFLTECYSIDILSWYQKSYQPLILKSLLKRVNWLLKRVKNVNLSSYNVIFTCALPNLTPFLWLF